MSKTGHLNVQMFLLLCEVRVAYDTCAQKVTADVDELMKTVVTQTFQSVVCELSFSINLKLP